MRRHAAMIMLAGILTASCANMGPPPVVGQASASEVMARHGKPAMHWKEADGTVVHIYTTAPGGTSSIMARFDPNQRLKTYEELLNNEHFKLIREGMTMDEVQRIIGPPWHPWTAYFERRDELVWEWRFCDSWSEMARFNVLFDGTSKRVRSTMSQTESQMFSGLRRPCGHTYIQYGGTAINIK